MNEGEQGRERCEVAQPQARFDLLHAQHGRFETVVVTKVFRFDLFKLCAEFVELSFADRGLSGWKHDRVFDRGVEIIRANDSRAVINASPCLTECGLLASPTSRSQ